MGTAMPSAVAASSKLTALGRAFFPDGRRLFSTYSGQPSVATQDVPASHTAHGVIQPFQGCAGFGRVTQGSSLPRKEERRHALSC